MLLTTTVVSALTCSTTTPICLGVSSSFSCSMSSSLVLVRTSWKVLAWPGPVVMVTRPWGGECGLELLYLTETHEAIKASPTCSELCSTPWSGSATLISRPRL